MNPVKELKDIVTRLEALTSGASGTGAQVPTGPSYPAMTDFDAALKDFTDSAANTTEQGLKDITPIVVKSFNQMKVVLDFASQMKKPDDAGIKLVIKALKATIDPIAKFSSNQNIQPHVKVILEGLNSVFWVVSDLPKSSIEAAIEPAEFMLLKVRQQKIVENTKWGENFIKTLKKLLQYQTTNFQMGLNWNFKGTKTVDELVSTIKNGPAPPKANVPPPPPPPAQLLPPPPPPPPAPLAPSTGSAQNKQELFAQLNVGEDITKSISNNKKKQGLKKVDKQAVQKAKEETATPQQVQFKQTTQKPPVSAKPPSRHFKENWIVENFVNEKLIEFKEDEADMKQSIFIDNCVNCGFIIKPKVKSIFLQNCSKIQLFFEQVISSVEIVGCKRVEIVCLNTCPSFLVDNSESIHMTFNNIDSCSQCEILSAKTMDFNVTYLQSDGDPSKDTTLPEQFITKFDPETKKFVTKPHEVSYG